MPVDATEQGTSSLSRQLAGFYGNALGIALSKVLDEATGIDGLELETALLRVELRELVGHRDPEQRARDFRLMVSGIDLLRKLVVTRYRLSPEAGKNLAEKLAAVIDELNVLLPPEPS